MTALVIVPPAVRYLAGPLLGPAMLAGCGEAGEVEVLDLNALWLRGRGEENRRGAEETPGSTQGRAGIVGDHAKAASVTLGYAAWETLACDALGLAGDRTGDRRRAARMWVSLREAELAAARILERLGAEWAGLLPTRAPRFVGVSVLFSGQVLGALAVSMLCRRRWPGVTVVWGGPHVTALADAIAGEARYGRWVDGFVAGYAEGTFQQMLRHPPLGAPGVFAAGEGLWRRAREAAAPVVPRFESLELYGVPRLTLPAQASRGCAYGRCAFCTYPANEGGYRSLGLAATETVVGQAAALGAQVSFKDAYAVPRSLDAIAELVGGRVEWSACTRLVPRLGAARLQRLAQAGLRTLEIGVESLDPETLGMLDKRQSAQRLEDLLEDAVGTGVHLVLNVMFGFPGQTRVQAEGELAVLDALLRRYPGVSVSTERNLLEVERASPMGRDPQRFGVAILRTWPWATCVEWDGPAWCRVDSKQFVGHHLRATVGG